MRHTIRRVEPGRPRSRRATAPPLRRAGGALGHARSLLALTLGISLSMLAATSAWAQTPTLVQHYYTGTNSPVRGLTANSYTFRLPNPTLPGNCLILFLDSPHGASVSSIADDRSNSWPGAAVTADGGVNRPITAAYVLPDVAAGTRVITVTFSAAVAGVHAVFLEYRNVAAADTVGSVASRTNAASPAISSGALAPSPAAPGSLVLHYSMDNVGQVGGQSATAVTAWSADIGWTMLGGDINNAHDTSSFALQARIADGTSFNPTLTATQAATDTFNSIALELKAAAAGTAPAPGIRIIKQQFYVHTALPVPGSWTEFFPARGNLLVAANIYPGSTIAPITDSKGNMWTPAHGNVGTPAIQYVQNAATSADLTITVPLTNANANTTITVYDIMGAAASSVLAQAGTVDETDASHATVINDAPSITPLHPNGIIIVAVAVGQGPLTGFAAGAPTTALFMPVTYPGETDLDTFDNADGYAHSYYGTDLAQQRYNWTLPPQISNSWNAAAVEFRTGVSAPASQTISVTTAAPASAAFAASFSVAATASSSLPVAITTTGGCSGAGTGFATIAMTSGTTACVLHFNQLGDTNFAAAPEVTSTTTAQKATQSIAVTTGAPATAGYQSTFTVAAAASSGLPVTIDSTGVCTGSGSGSAAITMSSAAGTCTTRYTQTGDSNFLAAGAVTEMTSARKASQSIEVTIPAPASAVYHASFNVAATASSGLPVAVRATGPCAGGGLTNGKVVRILVTGSTGTCTVHFNRAGTATYGAAAEITSDTAAQPAPQTIAVRTAAPAWAALGASFRVAATASSRLPVTITTAGACSGQGSRSASVEMTSESGNCVVMYDQAGNGHYLPAAGVISNTSAAP